MALDVSRCDDIIQICERLSAVRGGTSRTVSSVVELINNNRFFFQKKHLQLNPIFPRVVQNLGRIFEQSQLVLEFSEPLKIVEVLLKIDKSLLNTFVNQYPSVSSKEKVIKIRDLAIGLPTHLYSHQFLSTLGRWLDGLSRELLDVTAIEIARILRLKKEWVLSIGENLITPITKSEVRIKLLRCFSDSTESEVLEILNYIKQFNVDQDSQKGEIFDILFALRDKLRNQSSRRSYIHFLKYEVPEKRRQKYLRLLLSMNTERVKDAIFDRAALPVGRYISLLIRDKLGYFYIPQGVVDKVISIVEKRGESCIPQFEVFIGNVVFFLKGGFPPSLFSLVGEDCQFIQSIAFTILEKRLGRHGIPLEQYKLRFDASSSNVVYAYIVACHLAALPEVESPRSFICLTNDIHQSDLNHFLKEITLLSNIFEGYNGFTNYLVPIERSYFLVNIITLVEPMQRNIQLMEAISRLGNDTDFSSFEKQVTAVLKDFRQIDRADILKTTSKIASDAKSIAFRLSWLNLIGNLYQKGWVHLIELIEDYSEFIVNDLGFYALLKKFCEEDFKQYERAILYALKQHNDYDKIKIVFELLCHWGAKELESTFIAQLSCLLDINSCDKIELIKKIPVKKLSGLIIKSIVHFIDSAKGQSERQSVSADILQLRDQGRLSLLPLVFSMTRDLKERGGVHYFLREFTRNTINKELLKRVVNANNFVPNWDIATSVLIVLKDVLPRQINLFKGEWIFKILADAAPHEVLDIVNLLKKNLRSGMLNFIECVSRVIEAVPHKTSAVFSELAKLKRNELEFIDKGFISILMQIEEVEFRLIFMNNCFMLDYDLRNVSLLQWFAQMLNLVPRSLIKLHLPNSMLASSHLSIGLLLKKIGLLLDKEQRMCLIECLDDYNIETRMFILGKIFEYSDYVEQVGDIQCVVLKARQFKQQDFDLFSIMLKKNDRRFPSLAILFSFFELIKILPNENLFPHLENYYSIIISHWNEPAWSNVVSYMKALDPLDRDFTTLDQLIRIFSPQPLVIYGFSSGFFMVKNTERRTFLSICSQNVPRIAYVMLKDCWMLPIKDFSIIGSYFRDHGASEQDDPFAFLMSMSQIMRQKVHSHLLRLIEEKIDDRDYLKFLVDYVLFNQERLFLFEDTILYQRALECEREMEMLPSENPHFLHAKLKNLVTEEPLFKLNGPFVQVYDKKVSIYIDKFRETARQDSFTYEEVHRFNAPSKIKVYFQEFIQRYENSSEKSKIEEAVVNLCKSDFDVEDPSTLIQRLYFSSIDSTYIAFLLNEKNPNGMASVYYYKFACIVQNMETLSNQALPEKVLSEREERLILWARSLASCRSGQKDLIDLCYADLDVNRKFLCAEHRLRGLCGEDLLEHLIKTSIQGELLHTLSVPLADLYRSQCAHPSHNATYLKNRLSHQIGLSHNLEFDLFVRWTNPELMSKSTQELLDEFANNFSIPRLLKQLAQEMTTALSRLEMNQKLSFQNKALSLCREANLCAELDDETFSVLSFNERAAFEVLLRKGYLVEL